MNTKSDFDKIQEKFNQLLSSKSEEDLIKEDEYILMANYLSEIERIQKQKNINKKKLAQLINISASYLTQVFRGDKPLNFYTIAKIQRKLGIRFSVHAVYKNKLINEAINSSISDDINLFKYQELISCTKYTNQFFSDQMIEVSQVPTHFSTMNN